LFDADKPDEPDAEADSEAPFLVVSVLVGVDIVLGTGVVLGVGVVLGAAADEVVKGKLAQRPRLAVQYDLE
jgi:hypothetical protein